VDGTEQGLPYIEIAPGVRLYDVRGRYSDTFGASRTEKIGYTIHHDAIPMVAGGIDGDLARLNAIHRYHTQSNGWGGIGYHRVISPAGRTYLIGGSGTQRAHVAGLNHLWIGYCFMGDWSNSRPPEAAMHALRTMIQWETDQRGVGMYMRPHKALNLGATVCPGGWAATDAWESIVLRPSEVLVLPQGEFLPEPTVAPSAAPPDVAAARVALDSAAAALKAARAALGG